MELISVIIPVYKVEPYLDECIESVLNQTYRELEILLIDDGSPDRCPEMCDAWAGRDPRIRVIHKENGGLSDARNVGLAAATGAYIAFVDSDDVVEPRYIEYLHQALVETGADLSECSYKVFCGDAPGRVNAEAEMIRPIIQTSEEALLHWSTHTYPLSVVVWNKLFRRELTDGELFAMGYYAQDALFTCQIFRKCSRIAHIDNLLYHWRNTPGSATKQFPVYPLQTLEIFFLALECLSNADPLITKNVKLFMCLRCIKYFVRLRKEAVGNKTEAGRKMFSLRRRIRFTREEWKRCSLREKLVILCSGPALVRPCVWLYTQLRPLVISVRHLDE